MRSVYITLVYFGIIALGCTAPFVLTLGYLWVDTFNPQLIVYSLLNSIPVSLIMAVAAVGSYVVGDRRSPPPFTLTTGLVLCFAAWCTLSTFLWAVDPVNALAKWDIAIKTILFSAFIPYVIRSRVQIEAFLQVYVFAMAVQYLPIGVKTLISGGGYGVSLGILSGNSGFAEGGLLSTVTLMMVPLILFLQKNALILPRLRVVTLMYWGLAVACIAGAIGTYERSALVGLVVLGGAIWARARRKLLFGAAAACAVLITLSVTSSAWNERMGTIDDYKKEDSALGRILVWEWTLGFVATHPQGGGFNAYTTDVITFPATKENPQPVVIHGKAFHSIYFEVLGEQGWVGFGIFSALVGITMLGLQRIIRRGRRDPELAWCRDLAIALQGAMLVMLSCGAFVGLAFQPMFYYLFALSNCLTVYVRRVSSATAAGTVEPGRVRGPRGRLAAIS